MWRGCGLDLKSLPSSKSSCHQWDMLYICNVFLWITVPHFRKLQIVFVISDVFKMLSMQESRDAKELARHQLLKCVVSFQATQVL